MIESVLLLHRRVFLRRRIGGNFALRGLQLLTGLLNGLLLLNKEQLSLLLLLHDLTITPYHTATRRFQSSLKLKRQFGRQGNCSHIALRWDSARLLLLLKHLLLKMKGLLLLLLLLSLKLPLLLLLLNLVLLMLLLLNL